MDIPKLRNDVNPPPPLPLAAAPNAPVAGVDVLSDEEVVPAPDNNEAKLPLRLSLDCRAEPNALVEKPAGFVDSDGCCAVVLNAG